VTAEAKVEERACWRGCGVLGGCDGADSVDELEGRLVRDDVPVGRLDREESEMCVKLGADGATG
jgi:hypothetical protein